MLIVPDINQIHDLQACMDMLFSGIQRYIRHHHCRKNIMERVPILMATAANEMFDMRHFDMKFRSIAVCASIYLYLIENRLSALLENIQKRSKTNIKD